MDVNLYLRLFSIPTSFIDLVLYRDVDMHCRLIDYSELGVRSCNGLATRPGPQNSLQDKVGVGKGRIDVASYERSQNSRL